MKLEVHRGKEVAEPDFRKKNPLAPFLGQKGPKWAQNEVFGTLKKIESLVFSDSLHEVKGQ